MGDRSAIEWTDATWNPIRARHRVTGKVGWHCEHASPGCIKCYAEGMNRWRGTGLPFKPGHGPDIELFLDERVLLQPLRWARPRRIFPGSMTDLFGEFVADDMLDRVFAVMALCPQHTFQCLTKRSARMRAYMTDMVAGRRWICDAGKAIGAEKPWRIADAMADGWGAKPLPNVWLGVSAEDQRRADERRDDLASLARAGSTTFVSYEPALGPVDWTGWDFLKQMISGGESGPQARPSHPDWHRAARDFCVPRGIAYFFKQWGEWKPISAMPERETEALYRSNRQAGDGEDQGALDDIYGRRCTVPVEYLGYAGDRGLDRAFQTVDGHGGMTLFRVGKHRAGRLLDGREHNGMPAIGAAARAA